MAKFWRVYSGADGKSHVAELPMDMKPFKDVEGAYGEAGPTQAATGITFRMSPPGYRLDWHCAPRRQYSISLSGQAEIEVGDGTVARVGPGRRRARRGLDGPGARDPRRRRSAAVLRDRAAGVGAAQKRAASCRRRSSRPLR